LTNAIFRKLVAVVACVFSASAFAAQITTTHVTTKVRPQVAPPPAVPPELVAARNEFVAFQIVVQADQGPLDGVRATFNGLTGAGTIDASYVQMYREGYLNLTQVSFSNATPGQWPDPLVPDRDETVGETRKAFPFSVPNGESRVIWVEVLVPVDARPGKYQGEVLVQGSGFEQAVPVKLTVLPTELPSTSNVATAFLFFRDNACRAHTGTADCGGEDASHELTSKYQKLALEHRVTLSNPLRFPSDGDWATFDRRYSPWLDGTAPSRLPGAKMTSVQFTGPRDPAMFKAFEQHMKQRGWLERAYDYTGDEPPYGISFDEARARAQAVKAWAPELRTLITTSIDVANAHGITPYLDVLVPIINFMDGLESPYIGDQRHKYDAFLAKAPQKQLWIYQACPSHGCAYGTSEMEKKVAASWPSYGVDASAARNRAMQWLVFLENATGELYYETVHQLPNAWNSLFNYGGNGDGTLFYPGQTQRIGGQTDVPLPSIRLKQIRHGMQDYEWLKKVADAGDPAFARETARLLIPKAYQVGDDGATYEAARLRLIGHWMKLTGHAEDADFSHCIPSDQAGEEPLCPDGRFWSRRPVLGKVGCSAAIGVPAGLALLALVGAAARRRREGRHV
jgi:hypothetical protein